MACATIAVLVIIGLILISLIFFAVKLAILGAIGALVGGGIGFFFFGQAGMAIGGGIGLLLGLIAAFSG